MYRTLFLLSLLVLGCQSHPELVKNQHVGNALGTTYGITFITTEEMDLERQIDSVFQVVNQSMSTYIPDSDISKINQGDTTVVVDAMFKEVFALSSQIHQKTAGYFDPTVGVLVNAWGFGPGEQQPLDSVKVDSLLQYVGFDKVVLTEKGTIQKERPELAFDFNAIAKGYAIDRLGALLNARGVQDYLVEVGGEILAKGRNTITKKLWTVGIDDPQVEIGRKLKRIIQLQDAALASSGNYRKFRIDSLTGEKYVHTIDPKTGFTKNAKVLAASVIAADCATADAYATAFMAMELEDSKKLLDSESSLEAYLIYLDDDNRTQEFMTDGFANLVKE